MGLGRGVTTGRTVQTTTTLRRQLSSTTVCYHTHNIALLSNSSFNAMLFLFSLFSIDSLNVVDDILLFLCILFHSR